jgi:hypothetical protein
MSDLLKAFMGPQDGDVRWEGGVITRVFNGGAWHNVPAPLCFQLASALNKVEWLKVRLVEAEYKADNSAREIERLVKQNNVLVRKCDPFLSSADLKAVDKHCDWVAFGHAYRAMLNVRAALSGDKHE